MPGIFPDQKWLNGFVETLNTSDTYANVAKKWEGDMIFEIKADGPLEEDVVIYLDLWHGKCRSARVMEKGEPVKADFILSAPFGNFVRVLTGELDPMQAMLTRKLSVKGSMGYMMRNVPTVLEFVKNAQNATDKVLGE